MRRPPLETTESSAPPRAEWTRRASPTARAPNASAGSRTATSRAPSKRATPSRPGRCRGRKDFLSHPPVMLGTMKKKDQLTLLQAPRGRWRIDGQTRAVGRKGLEQARQALAEAA